MHSMNVDVSEKRRILQEAMRNGENIVVSPTGEVEKPDSNSLFDDPRISVPQGKLAGRRKSYYWYQSDPELYQSEFRAMKQFFPDFEISQLNDGSGRLYWRGKVQPLGEGGLVWDLMLIYQNDHPLAESYGGSIQILPIYPRLKDIAQQTMELMLEKYGSYDRCSEIGLGLGLPHIYRGQYGRDEEYFICSAAPEYFKAEESHSTSAASALSWACKWCFLCEMWLNGDIGDEVALEGLY